MDNKGPSKAIYYEFGCNFYKNVIASVFTVFIILLLNVAVYFLLSWMPCELLKKGAKKIKLRWIITLSDLTETLVLPISLFGLFQMQYVTFLPQFIWIYILMVIFCGIIITFPFTVILFVQTSSKKGIKKEIFEDLFQDVELTSRVSYIIYTFAFLRKFFFAMFLSPILPGLVQIILLVTINTAYLFLIIYIVINKIFTSKIKVLIRIISLLSLISLEIVILVYNMNYSEV